MSKSKIQEKFDAGESLNWFELVEWEKEVLEEKKQAREKEEKTGQAQSCDESVDQEPIQLELEAVDASISDETENDSVPESRESIPLKSLLEIGEYKLEASEKLPEAQAEDGLEHAEEIFVELENTDSARIKLAASGNEPTASTSGLLDSLPDPCKSLNADERKFKTSQKRKKHLEDESSSDVIQKRRNLERKCSESSSASQSESDKNPNPPLNGKLENDPGIQAHSKKQKIENPVNTKRSRKASSGKKLAANQIKRWECDQCGKKVGFKSKLVEHLQIHFTTKDFKCSICSKAFKTSNNRLQHERRHTAPKVQCKICGKESKNRFALTDHYAFMHSDRRKAECGICKKNLSSKQRLREHEQKIHKLN
jgi:hypothetical protein